LGAVQHDYRFGVVLVMRPRMSRRPPASAPTSGPEQGSNSPDQH
jgi:hypothetical protein